MAWLAAAAVAVAVAVAVVVVVVVVPAVRPVFVAAPPAPTTEPGRISSDAPDG